METILYCLRKLSLEEQELKCTYMWERQQNFMKIPLWEGSLYMNFINQFCELEWRPKLRWLGVMEILKATNKHKTFGKVEYVSKDTDLKPYKASNKLHYEITILGKIMCINTSIYFFWYKRYRLVQASLKLFPSLEVRLWTRYVMLWKRSFKNAINY